MTMARKKAAGKKKKCSKTQGGPSWGSLVLGIAIGLAAGLAIYLLRPAIEETTQPSDTPTTKAPAPSPEQETAPAARARPQSPPQPEQNQRFDFYTLLPQIEMEIPKEKLEEALRLLPKTDKSGTYILQVGSFRDYDDADELKARLALLGIESDIQTVVIKNGESWHRVRIGPFQGLDTLKPIRRKLRRNDIDFLVIKIGED